MFSMYQEESLQRCLRGFRFLVTWRRVCMLVVESRPAHCPSVIWSLFKFRDTRVHSPLLLVGLLFCRPLIGLDKVGPCHSGIQSGCIGFSGPQKHFHSKICLTLPPIVRPFFFFSGEHRTHPIRADKSWPSCQCCLNSKFLGRRSFCLLRSDQHMCGSFKY